MGKGLFAGAVGTAAMTVSSTLEMRARGRAASTAPADAAGKVLGVEPKDEAGEARFASLVHWSYGTGWGAVRGLIGAAGLEDPAATAAPFGAVWGSEQVMLPALGVAPPFWTWGPRRWASTPSTTSSTRALPASPTPSSTASAAASGGTRPNARTPRHLARKPSTDPFRLIPSASRPADTRGPAATGDKTQREARR